MKIQKIKRKRLWELIIIVSVVCFFWLWRILEEYSRKDKIIFGTSAISIPMTFYRDGKIVGFEVDLAEILAKKLRKKPVFKIFDSVSVNGFLINGAIDVFLIQ